VYPYEEKGKRGEDPVPLYDELADPEDKLAWNSKKQVCHDRGTSRGGRVRKTPSNTTK
jgi:hypothetical protein